MPYHIVSVCKHYIMFHSTAPLSTDQNSFNGSADINDTTVKSGKTLSYCIYCIDQFTCMFSSVKAQI